ncbi:MAG: hypothetical protein NC313_05270 [Butyrivibrio sp.]|nr:hypothetical protein [Butyrivibrio sp.]
MGNQHHIEGIYNLTLVRNNSHARQLNFEEDSHIFFMLDYFNFLYVKKLENHKAGYKMLCGINDDEDMAAARKIMGIYGLVREGENVKDLFCYNGLRSGETSGTPFLGIIQINIIAYERKGEEQITLDGVQDQLLDYRNRIEDSLKNSLGEDGNFQVFQTITSEDFCVAVRASQVRRIYEAVTGLMEIKNQSGKRVFFTYTNVGIECIHKIKKHGENGQEKKIEFLGLNEAVAVENEDMQFVIRFRMENCVLKEIQQMLKGSDVNYKLEAVNGLFGRYDLVARISVWEFREIYPYLCRNKAGYSIKVSDDTVFASPFVNKIVVGMENGTIKTINIRVLMDLNTVTEQESSNVQPWFDSGKAEKIEIRSESVRQQFKEFQKNYGNRFVFNRYRYADLCNMLERLMGSYKNLAYELDTHTNWFICSQYLEIFFENMNYYMEGVSADDRKAMEKFMNEFQAFVNAFGEFVRILQDNNQHTIQAPRYDVVAPIDGQKFLLAYGEYMDHMHEQYCSMDWDAADDRMVCREERRRARVIIYPDVSRERIEMMEVVQYDSCVKKDGREKIVSLLLCGIPVFEYFERTYDLIPLISHEICHHMLVLGRSERNDFLIKMLFREISKLIGYNIQAKAFTGKYVVEYDSITELLSECLEEVLTENYKKESVDVWKNYVSNHISIDVRAYMKKILREEERDERMGVGNIPWENIVRRFYDIAKEIYAEDDEFQKMIKECQTSKKIRNAEDDKAVREIYELLLSKINELLPIEEGSITREALKDKTYLELDDFLVKWHKDYIAKHRPDVSMRQELKHYVDLIRRLQVVYHDALCWKNGVDQDYLDCILGQFSRKVEERFRNEFLEGDKFCIYSLDQMERVAYWELLKPEWAKRNYQEVLSEISLNEIYSVIDHTATLYRESCADTIMCKWLGFDSFGYFRMAVTFSERMANYWEEISETGLFRRRLIAVMAVLLHEEDKGQMADVRKGVKGFPIKGLWDKIKEYIEAEVQQAKKRTMERLREAYKDAPEKMDKADEVYKNFFKILKAQMKAAENQVSDGKAPIWEGALWDDMFKEDGRFFRQSDKDLRAVFQKEINLYRRVYLVMDAFWHLKRDEQVQVESEILNHLVKVYNGIKRPRVHPIVEKVVRFYNNPSSETVENFEKMEGMLRFIQDYYYYNRFRKMQEEEL